MLRTLINSIPRFASRAHPAQPWRSSDRRRGQLSTLLAIILAMATSEIAARPPGRKRVGSEPGVEAYRQLREGIISGRFHPNERLVEANLIQLLGAGRTAIRAALVRLDQEGLVTREHNRGARVRLVSDHEALEIEEVRSALERLLARQAAAKANASDLRELRQVMVDMRRCFANGDAIGYSELNPRFHQLIWAAAKNPTAGRLVGTLKS